MEKFVAYINQVGEAKLAALLGITRQAVNHWKMGKNRPSVTMVKRLVRLSGGQLRRADIRPDVYES